MNPFINPKKRDVSLPAGCKDLIDVLEREAVSHNIKTTVTDVGLVITAWLPGLRSEGIEITGKKADSHTPFQSVIHAPSGYCVSVARAAYLSDELQIIIPESAAKSGGRE